MITQDLGIATAYGYAKSKGYTGTEAEFAELMASYASTAQTAIEAANRAVEANTAAQSAKTDASASASTASTAAQTATTAASEASQSASTATTKASEASQSASTASSAATSASTSAQTATAKAGTATAKASEAAASEAAALSAKTDAESARDAAAQSASEAAESARTLTIDATLTQSGQAADAKATGKIKSDLNAIFNIEWETGKYINASGREISNANFESTDYIELSDVLYGIEYALCLNTDANAVSYYTEGKTYISGVRGAGNNTQKTGVLEYPVTDSASGAAKYVRFSHCIASGGVTNPAPVIKLKNIALDTKLARNAVTTPNITNNAVTEEKCAFIVHDPESNYIDKTKYLTGYINASGDFVQNASWRATDYCELEPEKQYFSSQVHGGYCAFYRADKSVIAAYGANSFIISSFTTPAETAFGRFSINAGSHSTDINAAWVYTSNEKPKDYAFKLEGVSVSESSGQNPCDYDGNEISVFNKILCIGDSMTEGTFNHLDSGNTQWVTYPKYAYPAYLHKMTGVDVTNLGHGGKTAVQWYEIEQDSDLSGYDCAIVQLGINDYGTYGALGDETKTAFQNIISKLKTQNKNIKIFVANIIPATSYSTTGYKQFSADLLEWLETTYESDKDVIPVDIQQYGHTGSSPAYNCGHLSAFGYRRLAEDYKNYISWYISKNKEMFREVQFIGTDYWYTNPNT